MALTNRAEIKRLTTTNSDLLEKLKRFSQEIDTKMAKIKTGKPEKPEAEVNEQKQLNEIECLIAH